MAFKTGSQINPALGRTDYSPFTGGAVAGAQMAGRGGELFAQGVGNGMGSLTQGIMQYQQNKQMAATATAQFEGAVKADPNILQQINSPEAPPEVAKAFKKLQKDGAVGVKDAAALATFAGAYTKQKQDVQKQQYMQMQMQVMQGRQQQEEKDTQAFAKALGQFLPGNAPAGIAKPAQPFSIPSLVQEYFKQGGSPQGMDKVDQVIKMMAPGQAQNAPSGYKWKPDGTLEAIKGGPADVGNKPLPQKYTPGQAMVSTDGRYLGNLVFDQTTGVWGIGTSDGKIAPVPQGATPATATSFTKDTPSITEFKKLKDQLTDDEIALRRYTRYLSSVKGAREGVSQLADTFMTAMNTFVGKGKDITPEQLSLAVAKGQLQGLLGASRLDVVGGGVMTEQDALRVISRLGGDVGSFQNKAVVQRAISDLFSDKYEKYKNAVQFYNAGVKSFYGQHGFQEAEPLKADPKLFTADFFAKPEDIPPPTTITRSQIQQQILETQKRIDEMRRKAAEGK